MIPELLSGAPSRRPPASAAEPRATRQGLSRRLLVLGLVSASSVATAAAERPAPTRDPRLPNVVVFYLDDLGTQFYRLFDDVNPWGSVIDPVASGLYVQTPVLDRLASRGVVFTSAYATPNCSPGRACLLTGRAPASTGVGSLVIPGNVGGLAEFGDPGFEGETLADLAHRAGGVAGVIGKWHLALPTPDIDALHGDPSHGGWKAIRERGHWDDVRCTFGNLHSPAMANGEPGGFYNYLWYTNGRVRLESETYATSLQMSEALDFCRTSREPFLAYVAPNAPHYPLDDLPPPELVQTKAYLQAPQARVRDFQAALEALDSEMGRFLDGLPPERLGRTVVIVMGDNGTDSQVLRSLREEHGSIDPPYGALLNSLTQRFKGSAYEGGIHVPLIVSWPGIDAPGRVSDALVHVTDLFPTVAELWGLDTRIPVDGISFLPLLTDASVDASRHARQDLRIDFFKCNGEVEEAGEMRVVAYTRRLADRRRFKLLREFGLPGHAGVSDSLFLLTDAAGQRVDPYETQPLDTAPGSPYRAAYLECAAGLAPALRYNYCSSLPNASGAAALMSASGEPSVDANDLVLEAGPVLPGALGLFRYSSRPAELPLRQGVLCLSSEHFGPFDLPFVAATEGGVLRLPLDLSAPPAPGAAIHAGSTWRFQAFFRDGPASSPRFNLSDGLCLRWVP